LILRVNRSSVCSDVMTLAGRGDGHDRAGDAGGEQRQSRRGVSSHPALASWRIATSLRRATCTRPTRAALRHRRQARVPSTMASIRSPRAGQSCVPAPSTKAPPLFASIYWYSHRRPRKSPGRSRCGCGSLPTPAARHLEQPASPPTPLAPLV
jgi:hypothetical protein